MERFLLPTIDYPPKRGGVARMLSLLASHVPNMRPLVLPENTTYSEYIRHFWNHRKRFDVLFVSHVLPVGTAAWIYRTLTGTPYDVLLHGLDFDGARTTWKKSFALRCVLWGARRVYANSQALSEEIERYAKRSCKVLYPCVSDGLLEASTMVNARSKQEGVLSMLTVGRLVERKGHMKVLHAMKAIDNVTYTIVGDGPMKKSLEDEVVTLGLSDRVTFLQNITDGKLPDIYASHDIFVMPTVLSPTDREGFGIVYLEAGLFSLPVIATRAPGIDEAVIHLETGLLIEDDVMSLVSALNMLCSTTELRLALGRSARKRVVKMFTASTTFAALGARPESRPPFFPLISVVIPSYQHANVVGNAIQSVLQQTYPNIETIVVDDGSTDETQEVLKTFKNQITAIYQQNSGGNAARNRGLEVAKGEFVLFLDADVLMKPGMIDEMYAALMAHPEASYAYSGFKFGWKRFRGVPFAAETLKKRNFVMTSALVRRKDFPGFDPCLRRFQDWDVWLTMLEQGRVGTLVPGTWFRVIIDGESRTGSSWLPSFLHSVPWPILGWTPRRIQEYQKARKIIAEKHHLLL